MLSAGRRLAALAASLSALLLLLVGLPVLLLAVAGSPLTYRPPSLAQFHLALASDNYAPATVIHLLAVVGWLAWAWLVVTTLAGLVEALRHPERARRLHSPGAWLAHTTVVLAMAAQAASATIPLRASLAPPPAHHLPAASSEALAALDALDTPPAPPSRPSPAPSRPSPTRAAPTRAAPTYYTVRAGDNLWDIAAAQLGQAEAWSQIWAANRGRDMGDGQVFSSPALIEVGWHLLLPAPGEPESLPRPVVVRLRPEPATAGARGPGPRSDARAGLAQAARPEAPAVAGGGERGRVISLHRAAPAEAVGRVISPDRLAEGGDHRPGRKAASPITSHEAILRRMRPPPIPAWPLPAGMGAVALASGAAWLGARRRRHRRELALPAPLAPGPLPPEAAEQMAEARSADAALARLLAVLRALYEQALAEAPLEEPPCPVAVTLRPDGSLAARYLLSPPVPPWATLEDEVVVVVGAEVGLPSLPGDGPAGVPGGGLVAFLAETEASEAVALDLARLFGLRLEGSEEARLQAGIAIAWQAVGLRHSLAEPLYLGPGVELPDAICSDRGGWIWRVPAPPDPAAQAALERMAAELAGDLGRPLLIDPLGALAPPPGVAVVGPASAGPVADLVAGVVHLPWGPLRLTIAAPPAWVGLAQAEEAAVVVVEEAVASEPLLEAPTPAPEPAPVSLVPRPRLCLLGEAALVHQAKRHGGAPATVMAAVAALGGQEGVARDQLVAALAPLYSADQVRKAVHDAHRIWGLASVSDRRRVRLPDEVVLDYWEFTALSEAGRAAEAASMVEGVPLSVADGLPALSPAASSIRRAVRARMEEAARVALARGQFEAARATSQAALAAAPWDERSIAVALEVAGAQRDEALVRAIWAEALRNGGGDEDALSETARSAYDDALAACRPLAGWR